MNKFITLVKKHARGTLAVFALLYVIAPLTASLLGRFVTEYSHNQLYGAALLIEFLFLGFFLIPGMAWTRTKCVISSLFL